LFITLHSISLLLVLTTLLFQVISDKPLSAGFYLALSLSFTHALFLIGPVSNMLTTYDVLCTFQGAGIQFFVLSSACWIFIRAYQLYQVVVLLHSGNFFPNCTLNPVHLFCWGFPLTFVVVTLFFGDKMVYRDLWCWLPSDPESYWELGSFFGALFIFILGTTIYWTALLLKTRHHITQTKTIIFFIQNLIGIICTISIYATEVTNEVYTALGFDSYVLEILHSIAWSSLGLICFVAFGMRHNAINNCKKKFFFLCNDFEDGSKPCSKFTTFNE